MIHLLNQLTEGWGTGLWRASWQGGIAIVAAWARSMVHISVAAHHLLDMATSLSQVVGGLVFGSAYRAGISATPSGRRANT